MSYEEAPIYFPYYTQWDEALKINVIYDALFRIYYAKSTDAYIQRLVELIRVQLKELGL